MEIDLSERTAVVTGAGRGIGEEIAITFADAGANIVAAARTEEEIANTIDRAEDRGVEGIAVPTDLAEIEDVDALIEKTTQRFGPPDILVNNAAANIANSPLAHTVEEIDTMLRVNFQGVFRLTQQFAGVFEGADGVTGRVINISSIVGDIGVPAMTLYGGTKSGVLGLTRGFAAALAADGITVNSISPGLIGVERIEELIERRGDEIHDFDRIPLGRLGRSSDVADACLFLASDHASYITGENLRVDGGVGFTAGLYR